LRLDAPFACRRLSGVLDSMSNRQVKTPKRKDLPKQWLELKWPYFLKRGLAFTSFAVGLLGLLSFVPRPSVSASEPVDIENPFSSAFTVTNGNIFSLSDLRVGVAPVRIPLNGGWLVGDERLENRLGFLFNSKWEHHTLRMDEQYSVTPSDIFDLVGPFQGADLAIVVQYKLWFFPNSQWKAFRFQAHRQTNGRYYWYPTPLR
jgi:hypothetical protein